jgi:hypothetical protein
MPKRKVKKKSPRKRGKKSFATRMLKGIVGAGVHTALGASPRDIALSHAGKFAGIKIPSLVGHGDYASAHTELGGGFNLESNSIVKGGLTASQVPLLNTTEDGDVRIRHREFLRDIGASIAFSIGTFRLNPTDPLTFPWLSATAARFEQWVPLGIVFEIVSTSGSAVSSTNSSLGSIQMATQYIAAEKAFTSKQQLLNHFYAVSSKPSKDMMHAIECDVAQRSIPILNTSTLDPKVGVPGSAALQWSDLGYTSVASSGSQAGFLCGELWVTYDILLKKPRLPPGNQEEKWKSVAETYADMHPMGLDGVPEEKLTPASLPDQSVTFCDTDCEGYPDRCRGRVRPDKA